MRKLGLAIFGLCVMSFAWADSLQLKNGSQINGKYMGGDESSVTFQVGSSTQRYNVADIVSLTFDSKTRAQAMTPPTPRSEPLPAQESSLDTRPMSSTDDGPMLVDRASSSSSSSSSRVNDTITVPAGTTISVRMIDGVDSEKNQIGDRFQASLQEPLEVDGVVVAPRGADVYGRLSEAKEAGRLAGRSQLKLELTDIVINGRRQPIVTGEYQTAGSSRTASTAKRSVGGAAIGAIIGGIAGGGSGAAIGAGVGAGAGAATNTISKGEQVKVPSETLLDFRLQQPLTITTQR
jgi:hypothetical protein